MFWNGILQADDKIIGPIFSEEISELYLNVLVIQILVLVLFKLDLSNVNRKLKKLNTISTGLSHSKCLYCYKKVQNE